MGKNMTSFWLGVILSIPFALLIAMLPGVGLGEDRV